MSNLTDSYDRGYANGQTDHWLLGIRNRYAYHSDDVYGAGYRAGWNTPRKVYSVS